jgi:hypothetical protein
MDPRLAWIVVPPMFTLVAKPVELIVAADPDEFHVTDGVRVLVLPSL